MENDRLKKLNYELITKIKQTTASTPRKPFSELSSRQIRRISKEPEKFISRSPQIVHQKILRRLTALEDISVALEVGITGKQRERLKNEMDKLNYNIFSATNFYFN